MTTLITDPATGHLTSGLPTTEALRAHFAPVLEAIRAGAADRERDRRLPIEEIAELARAGFGRLRVPAVAGGFGTSFEQLTEILIDIAAADSNIAQALRGHIGFVEDVLVSPDEDYRSFWFAQLANDTIVGNAESERSGNHSSLRSRIVEREGRFLLNGTKYYTTGTLFADWARVTAQLEKADGELQLVQLAVATGAPGAPGVTTVDDWDGFGQRLTASGTTTFVDVEVDPLFFIPIGSEKTLIWPIYQIDLLAALVGSAEGAVAETEAYLRAKQRNFFNPDVAPTKDEAALATIGAVRGRTALVRAAVVEAARRVGAAVDRHRRDGSVPEDEFDATDAYVAQLWPVVIEDVLRITSQVFEVGGASLVSSDRGLDRHWRNARAVASNNPSFHQGRAAADYFLNGVPVGTFLANVFAPRPAAEPDGLTAEGTEQSA